MNNNEYVDHSQSQRRSNQQLIILAQLLQASAQMVHIDEMFAWLAGTIVQRLSIQVVQLWAVQASATGQASIVLRANSSDDLSLPQAISYNAHVAEVAGNFLRARQSIALQPVKNLFSTYQTNLFLRYGLNYCFGHFLSSDALLPPAEVMQQEIPTPFMMMALLLVRKPPAQDVTLTAGHVLEQMIPMAKRRGLLMAAAPQQRSYSTPQQQSLPPLGELIPHRTQEEEALRSQNPFAAATPKIAINDRQALRFYQAIDGKRTVFEIATSVKLQGKDLASTLRLLLTQKHIQLRDARGRSIDESRFLNLL